MTVILYPRRAAAAVRQVYGMPTYALVVVIERGRPQFSDVFPFHGFKLHETRPLVNYPDGVRA